MSADPTLPLSDRALLDRLPGVRVDRDNISYYRGLLEHRLLINRCGQCAAWHHPPRACCPHCWSWDVAPEEVSGKGVIHLFSFLNGRPAHGASSTSEPYPIAAVDLAEAIRFTATIIDCPKDELRSGLCVGLTWIDENGIPTPAFRPSAR